MFEVFLLICVTVILTRIEYRLEKLDRKEVVQNEQPRIITTTNTTTEKH